METGRWSQALEWGKSPSLTRASAAHTLGIFAAISCVWRTHTPSSLNDTLLNSLHGIHLSIELAPHRIDLNQPVRGSLTTPNWPSPIRPRTSKSFLSSRRLSACWRTRVSIGLSLDAPSWSTVLLGALQPARRRASSLQPRTFGSPPETAKISSGGSGWDARSSVRRRCRCG